LSIGFRFFFLQLTLSWCNQLPGGREKEITSSLVILLSWHQYFQLVCFHVWLCIACCYKSSWWCW
jgi:hypothetical protein